jgi:hypothetical protein
LAGSYYFSYNIPMTAIANGEGTVTYRDFLSYEGEGEGSYASATTFALVPIQTIFSVVETATITSTLESTTSKSTSSRWQSFTYS